MPISRQKIKKAQRPKLNPRPNPKSISTKDLTHIKCYFGKKQNNFGDMITEPILQHYARQACPGKQIIFWPKIAEADIVGIGSIFNEIPSNYQGYIWTTGNARPSWKNQFANAKIVAVRGPLTHQCISKSGTLIYGDAGLLMSDLYPGKNPEPVYDLGIIPHIIDRATVRNLLKNPEASKILVINLADSFSSVCQQMKQCRTIVSSSLHGLIVADSFEIPNLQFKVSTSKGIIGNDYKFQDYYASLGLSLPYCLKFDKTLSVPQILQSISVHYKPRLQLDQVKENLRLVTLQMLKSFA